MKELSSILKNIKNKTLQPVYFFHGEEPYFIDVAIKSFENDLLSEDEKAFGQTVVYGKDTNMAEIISSAQQFPMFGEMNLIVVKEAQDLKFSEEERIILENYIANPVLTTVLVFAHKYKKFPATTKVSKLLSANEMLFYSEPVKEQNLAKWISEECKSLGLNTAPNISQLLAEYLGNNLSRISNELQKLHLILKEGEILDGNIVETHIGISKEFNVFELIKAVSVKDSEKSMKIAYYMGKSEKNNPFVLTIGNLYNFFSNLTIAHAISARDSRTIQTSVGANYYQALDLANAVKFYSLKHSTRIISILREMDLKGKGLGAANMETPELMKELVFKILNVDKTKVKV